ncbi:DUF1836 domain-containing protein [Eubacterium aggregans]|uniref:DUF1836 domain-containing protein n=1 Tax=Eubacterium aggregans TaxID=81409 RepID=UPI003F2E798D
MDEQQLNTWLDALNQDSLNSGDQLPDIDLYMDQLITLCEQYLEVHRRHPEDKLLTKSMINNYSKRKMLGTVHKKKYTRGQVLMLYLIFMLKPVASIDDIQQLFNEFTTEDGFSPEDLLAIYPLLSEQMANNDRIFKEETRALWETIKKEPESAKMPHSDSFLMAFSLYSQALNYKRLADKLVDECLITPPH